MSSLCSRWLALALAGAVLPASQGEREWEEARAALHARYASRVEDLAGRAQEWKLFGQRDRLYEALVQLEPDHAGARQRLGYQRTARGWVRGLYRPGEDQDPEHADEIGELRVALGEEWRAELEALARRLDPGGEHLPDVMDDLLILVPDDPEARAFRREVRVEGEGWLLEETLRARGRRPRLAAGAGDVRRREISFEAGAEDPDSPIAWEHAYEARYGKLFACGDLEDALELLRLVETAGLVFDLAFGEVPDLSHDFSIYFLHEQRTRDAFLARHPRAETRLRRSRRKDAAIVFDEGRALAVWVPPGRVNRHELLRVVVDCMLRRSFRLREEHAWVRAGFGLRLLELVTGEPRRMRAFVPEPRRDRWRRDEGPWRRVHRLAAELELPPLADVVAPCDGDPGHGETLVAYAFARFLLEGHPEDAARFLDDLGRARIPLDRCLRRILDTDVDRLGRRLERWIAETG